MAGVSGDASVRQTFFLPAARADGAQLAAQIADVSDHPLTDALLRALHGVVLVLNPERQIVAFNRTLLTDLGIEAPDRVLGLRPGEVLGCVQAGTAAGGCGTTSGCLECGAALALLACSESGEPTERDCLMTRVVDGAEQPIEFRARAAPLSVDGHRFTVLSLRDVREEKRWLQMDQVLLHDLLNLMAGLEGTISRLSDAVASGEPGPALEDLQQVADRLIGAAKTHRLLCAAERGDLQPAAQATPVSELLGQLEATFRANPLLDLRMLRVVVDPARDGQTVLHSDRDLLLRVLTNMVQNALEAAALGTAVRVWATRDDFPPRLSLQVWNEGRIEPRVAKRIFTRYFTTKGGAGRGLGTYSMKLIGERVLGGDVRFCSTEEGGTTFRLTLPLSA